LANRPNFFKNIFVLLDNVQKVHNQFLKFLPPPFFMALEVGINHFWNHFWNQRAVCHQKKLFRPTSNFYSTMNFFFNFSIFTAYLREEDLKILKISRTKVLLA
jgi:hypothetical protein